MPPVYLRFEPIVLAKEDAPQWRFDNMVTELRWSLGFYFANLIKREMESVQTGWDHKVEIRIKHSITPHQFRVDITPFGRNLKYWKLVTGGVQGRYIAPRRSPYLSIRKGYSPHTSPGGHWGGPGTYSGPFYRSYGPVWWPGYEAREFEWYIAGRHQDEILRAIQRIILKWFKY